MIKANLAFSTCFFHSFLTDYIGRIQMEKYNTFSLPRVNLIPWFHNLITATLFICRRNDSDFFPSCL